jgi:hypothetical protein
LYARVFNLRSKDYFKYNDEIWVYRTCQNYNYLDQELGGYDYDIIDSKTKMLMAFSIMAPVAGGIALFMSCFFPCMTIPNKLWKLLRVSFFLLACLFQGITS